VKRARNVRTALLAGLLIGPIAVVAARRSDAPSAAAKGDRLARGKYLVMVEGCNDCHTPFKMGAQGPEPDMSRMLSGHPEGLKMPPPPPPSGPWVWSGAATNTAYAGPWGISYAINLTPDHNTGLGIWTEEMFVKSIKTGKHFGTSRPIQPPMPWQWYRYLSDDDLKAIFAYLKSVPAIPNRVPDWQEPAAPPKAPEKKG